MGRILLASILFSVFCHSLPAQVTFGSLLPPSQGALLDLKQKDAADGGVTATGGLMLPRVELTNSTNLSDISDATEGDSEYIGLMIYNPIAIGVDKCSPVYIPTGIYVWEGIQWINLIGEQPVYREVTLVDEGQAGPDLRWTLFSDGTISFCGSGDMDDWSTSSRPPWYSHRADIQSIVVDSRITSVGDYAFDGCVNLTGSLNFGYCPNLTNIGNYAFNNCVDLSGVIKFNGCKALVSIGEYAFNNCRFITGGLDFSDCVNLTTIGEYAFMGMNALNGTLSFSNCSSLTTISDGAFYNCNLSGNLDFTSCVSLEYIGRDAFSYCDFTGGLDLSNCPNLTTIGNFAFSAMPTLNGVLNLSGLTNLTKIGTKAFHGTYFPTIYISVDVSVINDPPSMFATSGTGGVGSGATPLQYAVARDMYVDAAVRSTYIDATWATYNITIH